MNSRIQGGCLIVIVLLLAVIAFKQFNQPPVMSAASPVVYKVCLNAHGGGQLVSPEKEEALLNKFALEGWQLVTMGPYFYVLKK